MHLFTHEVVFIKTKTTEKEVALCLAVAARGFEIFPNDPHYLISSHYYSVNSNVTPYTFMGPEVDCFRNGNKPRTFLCLSSSHL